MKTILIHSISGNDDSFFSPNERDGYNDPYIYLQIYIGVIVSITFIWTKK
mgnify:CR=1 FL=1